MLTGLAAAMAGGCGRHGVPADPPVNDPVVSVSAPAPGAPLPSQLATNDPDTILRRMVAAYKAVDSLQERVEADEILNFGDRQQNHVVTVIRYQKQPARLVMANKSGMVGTLNFFADGSSIVTYKGLTNQFIRRSFQGDLPGICKQIDKVWPQVLNPLAFLLSADRPEGLGTARLVGTEAVGGKPAYVIKSPFTPDFQAQLGKRVGIGNEFKPIEGEVTLWIGQDDNLLRKVDARFAWRGTVKSEELGTEVVTRRVQEIGQATQLIVNPRLSESDFRFIPPKGAQEIFIERSGQ